MAGNSRCGDPNSPTFITKTTDTVLQKFGHWFWTAPGGAVRPLSTLIDVYHDTVGSNGVLELDFAIDRDGLVAPQHEAAYRALGAWIHSCYGTPVPTTAGTPTRLNATTWRYELRAASTTAADRAVVREDIAHGQLVRRWSLAADGAVVAQGTSVGNRKVALFGKPVDATTWTLAVDAVAAPVLLQFDVFRPCSDGHEATHT